jgi:hypothetical protein
LSMNLTKYGVWIGRSLPEPDYGEAANLAEDLGFGIPGPCSAWHRDR